MLVPTRTPVQAVKGITSKGEIFPGRLTTRLLLMPRLHMNGAIILITLCAFVACTKVQLKLYVISLLQEREVKKIYSQANVLVSKAMLFNTFDIEIYLSLLHSTQKSVLSF